MESRMCFSVIFVVRTLVSSLTIGLFFGLFASVSAESSISLTQSKSQLWQSIENSDLEVQAKARAYEVNDSDSPHTPVKHSFEDALLMTLNNDLMRHLLSFNDTDLNDTDLPIAAKALDIRSQSSLVKNIDISKKYGISLPLPDGLTIDITLVEDSILPTQLAEKYPGIKTYRVLSNERVFAGKVDISPLGFHAMLQMLDGEIVFIDPVELNKNQYAVFKKSAQKSDDHRQHSCGVDNSFAFYDDAAINPLMLSAARDIDINDNTVARSQESLKKYTIAIATTGEYSAKFGGSVGATLAAITTTINRVNQILERDLGVHLSLAENNDLLINTNSLNDPFDEAKLFDLVFQNQEFIDSTLGNSNYDLGHLLTTSGGGLAAIASACNSDNKAKAASGVTSPRGDSFDLDFVAHEIGHQLGATHTFNSSQGACSTETRTARTAFEPGSGSSIMSYAGYCGLDNIQSNTDAMYHIGSIKQIAEYTNTGFGSRCGVVTSSENTPPQPNAGRDYTIPARTPFELTGSAVDSDGDPLLYAWEQLDAGDTSTESLDKGNNALFRVHSPSISKLRSFPPLENILSHVPIKGESLPSYSRSLKMSFVAQDSFNVAQSDEMTVKVARTGSRFALNYPRAHYTRGNTYPIYWNVANTDKAPVNCSSVNILLSLDGGLNFSYPIASNIINDGETLITIPVDSPTSSQGRFKIKCSDNIFFAVSHRNFFVTQADDSVTLEYLNEDQAETNLKDIDLNSNPDASSSGIVDNSNSDFNGGSGGGVFDFVAYLFLLLLILFRELRSRRSYK